MSEQPTPRPLRIGLIASLHHPIREPFAGGLERHTHQLAVGLAERGHDVVVFAADDAATDLDCRPIRDRSRPLRLGQLARKDPSMLAEGFLDEHHAYLGLMLELDDLELDVVHDNCLHHLPVVMAESLRTPMTMTLHTPPTPWLTSALQLSHGPTIAAVSHATARAWDGVAEVDRVIHNGVDLETWTPGPRPRGDHAIWTGRICPEKGTIEALRAAQMAGVPLHVAGPSSDRAYAARVRRAMGPHDRWLGHLGGRSLVHAVGAASVQVVSPCWDEPYGLVVAEALACDTPVAAFDRGGVPEVVDDTCAVLAAPDDVTGLADAILRAREIPAGAARRRAEAVADVDRMVRAYERLFQEVTA